MEIGNHFLKQFHIQEKHQLTSKIFEKINLHLNKKVVAIQNCRYTEYVVSLQEHDKYQKNNDKIKLCEKTVPKPLKQYLLTENKIYVQIFPPLTPKSYR